MQLPWPLSRFPNVKTFKPVKSAVYLLHDGSRVIKVGETTQLARRYEDMLLKQKSKQSVREVTGNGLEYAWTHMAYVEVPDDRKLRRRLERALIRLCNPPRNKRHKKALREQPTKEDLDLIREHTGAGTLSAP